MFYKCLQKKIEFQYKDILKFNVNKNITNLFL